jgi:hypothetical protein
LSSRGSTVPVSASAGRMTRGVRVNEVGESTAPSPSPGGDHVPAGTDSTSIPTSPWSTATSTSPSCGCSPEHC